MAEQPRMLLVERDRAVCVGGRWDGWLFWMHPNGHWVSARKLPEAEPTVDWKLLFERFKEREPDCPACAEPHQAGQECQQKPWAEFREYLPMSCNPSSCNRCGAPIFSDETVTDQPCLDCIMGGDDPASTPTPADRGSEA